MEEKKKGLLGLQIHYAVIQSIYWIIQAIFMVFIVPLLRDRGFDNGQIGILLAVRSFTCIFFQPMVASFADRHVKTIPLKYIISIIVGISIVTTYLFIKIHFGFWGSCIIFGFLGASITALSPLYNSLAMQYLGVGKDLKYSIARGCGSIAYAFACIALGYIVDNLGVESTLLFQLGMLLISLLVIITFRACEVSQNEKKKNLRPHSTWYVLSHNKSYTIFLMASVMLFTGNNMTTSFLVDVVDKLGGTNTDVGYCQFVLAAVEFPMALFFMKLKKKIGTLGIMAICATFIWVKIMGILLAPNIPVLIAVHAFQMVGAGLYWSGSVYYVNEHVEAVDRIKGQSLMAIFSTGVGSGVGSLISGWISKYYGIDQLVLSGAICAGIGVALMFWAIRISENTENAYRPVLLEK